MWNLRHGDKKGFKVPLGGFRGKKRMEIKNSNNQWISGKSSPPWGI
jgi:hypothetical protein